MADGTHRWNDGAKTFKAMLLSTASGGYTYDPSHTTVNDITGGGTNFELNSGGGGTGYSAGPGGTGRKTLTTLSVSLDSTNHRAKFTADNLTWTAINAGTVDKIIIYNHVSGSADSSNLLVCCIDVTDTATTGSDLVVTWDALGIFTY